MWKWMKSYLNSSIKFQTFSLMFCTLECIEIVAETETHSQKNEYIAKKANMRKKYDFNWITIMR